MSWILIFNGGDDVIRLENRLYTKGECGTVINVAKNFVVAYLKERLHRIEYDHLFKGELEYGKTRLDYEKEKDIILLMLSYMPFIEEIIILSHETIEMKLENGKSVEIRGIRGLTDILREVDYKAWKPDY